VLEALSTPRNRTLTFTFLAISGAAAIAAGLVGIADNPPGIFLAFAAAAFFVLAFVHPWRSVRSYGLLLSASVVGLVVLAVLHNVFEGIGSLPQVPALFRALLQGLGVAAFLIAVLVCPPAIVVSIIGAIVMGIRGPRRPVAG